MKWKGRRSSSNVEDARGRQVSAGMGGAGAGMLFNLIGRTFGFKGILALLVIGFLLFQFGLLDPSSMVGGTPTTTEVDYQGTPEEQERFDFVAVVLADTEDVWNAEFRRNGWQYEEPQLVIFKSRVSTACGLSEAAMGPVYCPGDKKIYIDLDFYDELALYIAAGEEKLTELDSHDIPEKEAEVQAAPEDQQVMKAQELRDLRAARDDLERRVHDLKLTRQVTMQSLPSIRLVQENDKSLVTKINSTLVNTVPLWETQLAQAVTIQRSAEAAAAVRDANDLTNELLTSNAANLRESNKMIREEMERGVFDIEAVKQANADLIGTINESLAIADEGKAKRAAAEEELQKMEAELRDTLAAAKARQDGIGDNAGTAVPG